LLKKIIPPPMSLILKNNLGYDMKYGNTKCGMRNMGSKPNIWIQIWNTDTKLRYGYGYGPYNISHIECHTNSYLKLQVGLGWRVLKRIEF